MAQLLVTLLFVAIAIGAARLIASELSRSLVNQPNGFDDWLVDQLALANDHMMVPAAADGVRRVLNTTRPVHDLTRA